ncbi:MAG: element excision factor XisH family protein [Cyanobacteria bacterium J06581_3]
MSARDIYHDTVKVALIKDGWMVTDDPFSLKAGKRDLQVDLGAEKLLIAERLNKKIAVEVKSFISPSPIRDFELALGQYLLYASILKQQYPRRILYLAVRDEIFFTFFQEEVVKIALQAQPINILVFDALQQEVVQWIP